jgi:hypothetical protein
MVQDEKGDWHKQEFSAPQVLVIYNKQMGGIDQVDAAIAHYRLQRKTMKWTQALFCMLCV